MKKLNRKGFTLIELLAVIVILAIILVIVVPKVFDVIGSSKKKSLVNSAKGLVKSFETSNVSALLTGNSLSSLNGVNNNTYACISTADAKKLGISDKDYNIVGSLYGDEDKMVSNTPSFLTNKGNCSLISKGNDGSLEVILVANPKGSIYDSKYASNEIMYASSNGYNSWNNIYATNSNSINYVMDDLVLWYDGINNSGFIHDGSIMF